MNQSIINCFKTLIKFFNFNRRWSHLVLQILILTPSLFNATFAKPNDALHEGTYVLAVSLQICKRIEFSWIFSAFANKIHKIQYKQFISPHSITDYKKLLWSQSQVLEFCNFLFVKNWEDKFTENSNKSIRPSKIIHRNS